MHVTSLEGNMNPPCLRNTNKGCLGPLGIEGAAQVLLRALGNALALNWRCRIVNVNEDGQTHIRSSTAPHLISAVLKQREPRALATGFRSLLTVQQR
jgi:hypothetical protein